jgi:hypothetical protein
VDSNRQKVICVKNTREIDGEIFKVNNLKIGTIYDMERILYTDDNSWDLWDCYIYDNDDILIVSLDFFENLENWREKQIDNLLS